MPISVVAVFPGAASAEGTGVAEVPPRSARRLCVCDNGFTSETTVLFLSA